MNPTPRFISGVFPFEGRGLDSPAAFGSKAVYTVPSDKRAQLIYFRAGNSLDELIYLTLMRDGKVMRYFPIGAKACVHVSLAVVEDIFPESKLEVFCAAPKGSLGTIVLDIGLLELD
jgi:hypothetical protein